MFIIFRFNETLLMNTKNIIKKQQKIKNEFYNNKELRVTGLHVTRFTCVTLPVKMP